MVANFAFQWDNINRSPIIGLTQNNRVATSIVNNQYKDTRGNCYGDRAFTQNGNWRFCVRILNVVGGGPQRLVKLSIGVASHKNAQDVDFCESIYGTGLRWNGNVRSKHNYFATVDTIGLQANDVIDVTVQVVNNIPINVSFGVNTGTVHRNIEGQYSLRVPSNTHLFPAVMLHGVGTSVEIIFDELAEKMQKLSLQQDKDEFSGDEDKEDDVEEKKSSETKFSKTDVPAEQISEIQQK